MSKVLVINDHIIYKYTGTSVCIEVQINIRKKEKKISWRKKSYERPNQKKRENEIKTTK